MFHSGRDWDWIGGNCQVERPDIRGNRRTLFRPWFALNWPDQL
jgi:hypothetical protein